MAWKNRLTKWAAPFNLIWDRFRQRLGAGRNSPVQLMAYRGFCSSRQLWMKGRVLEDRLIVARREDSTWRNLINTYKRFNSREIWGAELEVQLGNHHFLLKTDREGYFELNAELPPELARSDTAWIYPEIELIRTPWSSVNEVFRGEILFPRQPKFGIISDIDDTIIRTGVSSRLMWRAIYRTVLKNAGSRVIFKEATAFFNALSESRKSSFLFNPVFYVSNSPWNLYDLIDDFMAINQLPKGPILLRDFGLPTEPQPNGYRGHKYETIARIFRTFPQMAFVLIGDSGEHDADIYLEITQRFPGRVKAIYIRDVQHRVRTRRVRDLIQRSGLAEIKLFNHFGEVVDQAESLGLLRRSVYEEWLIPA